MTLPWSGEARGAYISEKTVILFILTLGSAGTNLSILAYLALSLWTDGADIPFDALYTRLSPSQRGVVVIALTFPSYYMLSGRNLIPYRLFLPPSLSNFSLGVCLLISLSFSIPLPLHSKKRLIILQCQIQSESCWELELLCGVIPTGDQTSRENNTQGVSAVLKVHMCAGSFTGHVLHEWDYERWLRVWEFVATSVDICLRHYTQRRLGGKKKIKNTEFGHKETKQAFDW